MSLVKIASFPFIVTSMSLPWIPVLTSHLNLQLKPFINKPRTLNGCICGVLSTFKLYINATSQPICIIRVLLNYSL